MRNAIHHIFERWGNFTYQYSGLIICVVFLIAAGLCSQICHLEIDTSTEGFLHSDDPALITYNEFRNQFGRDVPIILAIEPTEVFDLEFLKKLKLLHEELENKVSRIEEVTSLINIRETRGEEDRLIVNDLLEEFPETPDEMEDLRKRVLNNPLYRDTIISKDGRIALIIIKTDAFTSIGQEGLDENASFENEFGDESNVAGEQKNPPPFLSGEENQQIVKDVAAIVEKYEGPDFVIHKAGSPIVIERLQEYIAKDMRLFMSLGLLTIAGFLYVLFRRITAVLLPILVIILSLLSTLSTMASFKVPITVPSQILPSFLVSIGVGYSVHLMVIFLQQFDESGNRKDSLRYAMGHSGIPIVMTGITTIAGLPSWRSPHFDNEKLRRIKPGSHDLTKRSFCVLPYPLDTRGRLFLFSSGS